MRRLITTDDLVETAAALRQRGWHYLAGKILGNAAVRTKTTFDSLDIPSADAWSIPKVLERWNEKITGSGSLSYEPYLVDTYLKGRTGLRMLSLGSGACSHEMNLARHDCFLEVRCVDLAGKLLQNARIRAGTLGLNHMQFVKGDAMQMDFGEHAFDLVLFHSSLHHFRPLEYLLGQKIYPCLRKDGLLVIHEYVGPNRLQWTKTQLAEVNRILKMLPPPFTTRFHTGRKKKNVKGPGWIRMRFNDPSEAAESEKILPLLRKYFKPLEEKPLGGTILLPLLKDIAHHFTDGSEESDRWLEKIFLLEDQFLEKEESQLYFGVYTKPF